MRRRIGVAALLQASEPAFLAVKLAGAGYLIFLGLHSLRAGLRRAAGAAGPADEAARVRLAASRAYRQGVLSNLGNPQFVDQHHGAFLPLLLLGFVFCTMTFTWLTGYAAAVAKGEPVSPPATSSSSPRHGYRSGARGAGTALGGRVAVFTGNEGSSTATHGRASIRRARRGP
jgi:LysE type translocator